MTGEGNGGDGGVPSTPASTPTTTVAGEAQGTLVATPGELDFSSKLESLQLTLRYFGTGTLQVHLESEADWVVPPSGPVMISGGWVWVNISVDRSKMSGGSHEATLLVRPEGADAEQALRVTVRASATTAATKATDTSISTDVLYYGAHMTQQVVVLYRNSGPSVSYNMSSNKLWATPTIASGNLTESFALLPIVVDRSALADGVHTGLVRIDVSNGEYHEIQIVAEKGDDDAELPTTLEVSSTLIDFGASGDSLPMEVWLSDFSGFSYEVSAAQSWTTISPASGSSAGGKVKLTITVDRSNLAFGSHLGTLTVSTPEGLQQLVHVLVSKSEPPQTLYTWPGSDHRLVVCGQGHETMTRLDGQWPGVPEDQWAGEAMIYRMQFFRDSLADNGLDGMTWWRHVRDTALAYNPNCVIGAQISAGDLRKAADMRFFPYETIPFAEFPASAYESAYDSNKKIARLRLSDPVVRAEFADKLVAELISREVDHAYLDNVRHPMTGVTDVSWPDQAAFFDSIRQRLHDVGMRMTINIAVTPSHLTDEDVDLFIDCTDGVTFELPFHPTLCRPDPERVQREIAIYRKWLDAGMSIQLINVWTPDGGTTDDQHRFMAGISMMVRRPGDAIFLHRGWWVEEPFDWWTWPTEFGAPLGDFELQGAPPVLTREFERARLTVDFGKSLDAGEASKAVKVTWK